MVVGAEEVAAVVEAVAIGMIVTVAPIKRKHTLRVSYCSDTEVGAISTPG